MAQDDNDTSGALASLAAPLKQLNSSFSSLKSSLTSVVEGPIKALSSGFSQLTGILADTAKEQPAAVKALTSNLLSLGSIVTGIGTQFESLAAPFTKFVDALAPGTMQVFALHLRDLNATIGTAVLPIVEEVSDALQEAAGIIKPIMADLAPVLRDLTHSILALLLDSLRGLMGWFTLFMPLLTTLAEIIRTLTDIWTTLSSAIRSFFVALQPIFEALLSLLQDTVVGFLLLAGPIGWLVLGIGYIVTHIKELLRWVQNIILGFARLFAITAALAGFGSTIDGMVKRLQQQQKEKEGGVGGAIQDASLKGFEQIGKDLAIAAAYAGGGEKKDTVEDLLPRLIEILELGKAEGQNFQKAVREALANLPEDIARAIAGQEPKQRVRYDSNHRDPVAARGDTQ